MKGLLFLGLVGAAIYGALVLSSDYLLPPDPGETALTGQSLGKPSDRQLRSWATDLPSLARSSSQELALPSPKPNVTPASSRSASSEAKPTTTQADGTYQPIEWAKVVLAAKVHGDASVSSPTLRFYPPGTQLQVVGRQNSWVQITDPTSRERGWVFDQYLVPADGPATMQTAMAATTSKLAAEPARAKRVSTAKNRIRAHRPAARTPNKFAFTQFDKRWERRAARRGFFFGRFARAE
jgi:Bacterial SH3 domain